ncbi:ornithine cyclodeaminase family protein [Rhodoligotrophos ferricapiens]|uniref:ornithine cyclodeaminase family protein n=1 Tax=Rhodoligotrophos ferricapiens TaxID=3069264 RepID=UPI00315DE581
MRIIDANAIRDIASYRDFVDALRDGFAGSISTPLRHHHSLPRGDRAEGLFLLMPAWTGLAQESAALGSYIGLKILSVFPDNPTHGRPSIQGQYLLIDGKTGAAIALIEGAELTVRRTASASALAASYLAREGAETLLLAGAGALAPHLARAHAAVRPIKRVLVWNRSRDKADALAQTLRAEGFEAAAIPDMDSAAPEADIISCATMSAEPLVHGAVLKPGVHVDLVGAFKPSLRESDDEVMRRGAVYVDTREGAFAEAGDIVQAIDAGALKADKIRGELADLCTGRVAGRMSDQEITVFKSVGTALEDLAAAIMLYRRAEAA